jgi:hypothetical protein
MTSPRTHSSHGAKIIPNVTDNEIANIEEGSLPSSAKTETTDANRLFLEKYRALDLAGQFEQSFPSFSDPSIGKEYRKFNQQSFSLIPCLLLAMTIISLLLTKRYNFPFIGLYEDPFTVCAQVSVIPGFFAFTLYLVSQFYLLHCKRNSAAFASYSKADRDIHRLLSRCVVVRQYDIVFSRSGGRTVRHDVGERRIARIYGLVDIRLLHGHPRAGAVDEGVLYAPQAAGRQSSHGHRSC